MKKILFLTIALVWVILSQAANSKASAGDQLQFRSSGHVLLFNKDGFTAAGTTHALKVSFVHAQGVTPVGVGDSTATGNPMPVPAGMPKQPADKMPLLKQVTYNNLWKGVTLTYKASPQGVLESTYRLDPDKAGRVDASQISLRYNRDLSLDGSGNLVISYPNGTVSESAPLAWQTIKGQRQKVTVSFRLNGKREVGFRLGAYTVGIPVEIDPTLSWNTFLGGSGSDGVTGIAVDGSGNVYVGGTSYATWGSPIRAFTASSDAFVAKLSTDGTLLWNTFLGGLGDDQVLGITLDSSGNVYVGGVSYSGVFNPGSWGSPIRAYTADDAFAAKLTSNGSLLWNTFLGGIDGTDQIYGIAVDGNGNVYVGGTSEASWGSPILNFSINGYFETDIFVAKLSRDGALLWNTFLGGPGADQVLGITLDSSGNVYVGGNSIASWGSPIMAFNTASCGFVAKLTSEGVLSWNTFFGGKDGVAVSGIAVDGSGNVYVGGSSNGTWGSPIRAYFITYGRSNTDGFVSKLSTDGALLWNTFLGGSGDDLIYGITLDSSGNVYVGGSSSDTWGSPIRAYTPYGTHANSFVAKLTSDGVLSMNTFLGNGIAKMTGIALDRSGNVFVGGYSDATWGSPIRAYTSSSGDGFVAKNYGMSVTAPAVTTTAISTYDASLATMGGNVTDDGGATVIERGVVYSSTNATPTIGGADLTQDANGTGSGSFSKTISGLSANTTYYARAYAINSVGTSYGSVQSFKTKLLPVITWSTPANIFYGTALSTTQLNATADVAGTFIYSPALGTVLNVGSSQPLTVTFTPTDVTNYSTETKTVNITVIGIAPSNLSYATPVVYVTGKSIPALSPTVSSGGAANSYSVSPALPAGLTLNATTGIISGTPTVVTAAANYLITATNIYGSATFSVNLTVNAVGVTAGVAPANLTYASPVVYVTGKSIPALSPTVSGGAVSSYSVSPALPAGLTLDATTGIISGIPTTVTAKNNYLVTATNADGSTTYTVSITINNTATTTGVAPANLAYATPVVYVTGKSISALSPTVTGGAVSSYSISPALPAGLTLNASTGIISGTPTAVTAAANYQVTATNNIGSTAFAISITINDASTTTGVAPANLTYATPVVYVTGKSIPALIPTVRGGAVSSYSVSPALPAGLTLNTTTGIISGTPTAVTAAASYLVTATNNVGSTAFAVSITINDAATTTGIAPANLTYATPVVYVTGKSIPVLSPTVIGGAVSSYSVTPALPTGLTLNTITGIISGTPTAVTAAATYLVAAMNANGSTTFAISITIIDASTTTGVAPSNLRYATPMVYIAETAIANLIPDVIGTVDSYSVSPTLPAGLLIDAATGIISGMPLVGSVATNYLVTATNANGSTTFSVNIEVSAPPRNLRYATPVVYIAGTAIANLLPDVIGTVDSYSVSPDLPEGLSLDPTTGIISGTPTVVTAADNYLVTATNNVGSTAFTVSITINDGSTTTGVSPANLSYTSPVVYVTGKSISALSPTVRGGAVNSYSVSPALPTGLTLDVTTGIISGIPTTVTAKDNYLVTASNADGSTTYAVSITINDVATTTGVAPANLTYATPVVYVRGKSIPALIPIIIGGAVSSYSVSPALPAGLTLNATTGIISGTPTVVTAAANYQVTATNNIGSTAFAVSITINDAATTTGVAPANLSYTSPVVYVTGKSVSALSPTVRGGAVISYSVSPALPAGLTLDGTTGIISGTPTTVTAKDNYLVTASNADGSTTYAVSITINDVATSTGVAPANLTYATPVVYVTGKSIPALSPMVTGGAVSSYSVSPALPTGLTLDPATGIISGTPTVVTAAANYTVTATNASGSTAFAVSITINDGSTTTGVAPANLSYASPVVYVTGKSISALSPTVRGGAVSSYSVNPALPAGLTLDGTTGIISGTPTTVTAKDNYLVTATNADGSTTYAVSITINDVATTTGVAPANLTYANPVVFVKGKAIPVTAPAVSGGAVSSYSVSPALPAGLTLDATTGIISGTPTVVTAVASYLVTATNNLGSTAFSVSITINDGSITTGVSPANLSYASPVVFVTGQAISTLSPTVSGGVVSSYSVSPALPAGLTLDATTGIISGTPTAVTAKANYTITATNADGSTTYVVPLTINDASVTTGVAPANLSYTSPVVFFIGKSISVLTPTVSGGAVSTYSVSPALPAGLTLDATTGIISGAPTAVTAAENYLVTATNGDGSTTSRVNILITMVGDTNGDGKIDNGEIAGDANGDGKIDNGEIAGDLNGDGKITAPEIAGDTNGDGTIDNGEIAGDLNGDGKITAPEIAGDTNGDGTIDNGEIAGDLNGDSKITAPEIAGDTNGDGTIGTGEVAGDTSGDGKITSPEIAGDLNGDGKITTPEIAGDKDGDGKIDNGEIAGDLNGDGKIIAPEIAGDKDGDGKIDNGEIAGDLNGDGKITAPEIAGDKDGDGKIDNGEIAGDLNGDGKIIAPEIAGDKDGDGKIDNGEIAGDLNGDGKITAPEIAGDKDGDGKIDNGEIAGDLNGDGKITVPEVSGDSNGNGKIDGTEIDGSIITIDLATPSTTPIVGCSGSSFDLSYTISSGAPTQYKITYDAAALAAGIQNVSYTNLPSSTTSGAISIIIPTGTKFGTYHGTLQMKNESGVESPVYDFQFTVNVSADYIIPKFDDVVLCDNSSHLFAAYQWYKNGEAISGATKQFYNDPNGLVGAYSLKVTTVDGQILYSCDKYLNIPLAQKVSVYPNPAKVNQTCTVKVTGMMDEDLEGATLSVYTMQGVRVYRSTEVKVSNSVTLPSIDGMYLGRVITSTGKEFQFKVIVAK